MLNLLNKVLLFDVTEPDAKGGDPKADEVTDEKKEDKKLDDKAIPYTRFKKVNDENARLKAERLADEKELSDFRKAEKARVLADKKKEGKMEEVYNEAIEELDFYKKMTTEYTELITTEIADYSAKLSDDDKDLVPDFEDKRKTLAWLKKFTSKKVSEAPKEDVIIGTEEEEKAPEIKESFGTSRGNVTKDTQTRAERTKSLFGDYLDKEVRKFNNLTKKI